MNPSSIIESVRYVSINLLRRLKGLDVLILTALAGGPGRIHFELKDQRISKPIICNNLVPDPIILVELVIVYSICELFTLIITHTGALECQV